MKTKGFTLIELLIVVAIIAILAAIAVPNFLEAQTRAKVSRVKADMRTLATAIEAYAVDHNKHPIDGYRNPDNQAFWYVASGPTVVGGVAGVTSPIAYLTSGKLIDPFRQVIDATLAKTQDAPDSNNFSVEDYRRYRYRNIGYTYGSSATLMVRIPAYNQIYGSWVLTGAGPDKSYSSDAKTLNSITVEGVNMVYDPTNGTVSRGDIVRSQRFSEQPGPYGNSAVQ